MTTREHNTRRAIKVLEESYLTKESKKVSSSLKTGRLELSDWDESDVTIMDALREVGIPHMYLTEQGRMYATK